MPKADDTSELDAYYSTMTAEELREAEEIKGIDAYYDGKIREVVKSEEWALNLLLDSINKEYARAELQEVERAARAELQEVERAARARKLREERQKERLRR